MNLVNNFTLEQRAIHHLILYAPLLKQPGLLHGKMGIAIVFYLLAQKTKNSIYSEFADELIEDVLMNIPEDLSSGFASGLCGIGWGIEFLIQNNFIEANSLEVCEEIDRQIMKTDPRRIEDKSIEKGLGGLLHYVLIHIKGCLGTVNAIPFDPLFLKDLNMRVQLFLTAEIHPELMYLCKQYNEFYQNKSISYESEIKNFIDYILIEEESIINMPLGMKDGLAGFLLSKL